MSAITTPAGSYSYTYDAAGNITQEKFNGTTVGAYIYDGLNQLTSATVNGVSHSYTYGDASWADKLTAYDGQVVSRVMRKII